MTPQQVYDIVVGGIRNYRASPPLFPAGSNAFAAVTDTSQLTTSKPRHSARVRAILGEHFMLLARLQQMLDLQPRNRWEAGLRQVAKDFNLTYEPKRKPKGKR